MNYKKATRSGAGSSAAKAAEKELKDFLAWYAPHVRLRQTQTNLKSTAINENEVVGDDDEDLMTNDLDRELDTDVPGNNDDEFSDANVSEAESNVSAESIRRRKREAVASSQNKRKNNSTTSTHTSKKSNVATMELEVMDRIGRAIEKRNSFEDKKVNNSSEDMDEIFGKMVSCELKTFSIRMKNQVKHEINNVIYKYQNMRDGFTEGNVIASMPPPTNAAHHQSSTHPNPFSSWLGYLQNENL